MSPQFTVVKSVPSELERRRPASEVAEWGYTHSIWLDKTKRDGTDLAQMRPAKQVPAPGHDRILGAVETDARWKMGSVPRCTQPTRRVTYQMWQANRESSVVASSRVLACGGGAAVRV